VPTANTITLARFPVLVAGLLLLYQGTPALRLAAVAILFAGLMLDTVDGIVARRRGQASLLGAVLDIAADRTYELALWIALADLGLVPVAIPLVVVARTSLTDGLRAVGVTQGVAPLAQQRGPLGRFLVASPWMRTGYSIAKVTTFCGLGAALAFAGFPAGSDAERLAAPMASALRVLAWVTVALCVARGAPVMASALRNRTRPPAASGPPAATLRRARPADRPA
jgi:phosphatidylglycerophosphate synthase